MPRKDPITGCEVMTFFEFAAEEGKRDGKDPGDIMDEIAQATADDNAQMEEHYRNPKEALTVIKEWVEGDEEWREDPESHCPEEVLEVLKVTSRSGFSGSKLFILARARCEDGKERIVEYHYQYWAGSRMEPPDEDAELRWHNSVEDYHSSVEQRKREKAERKKRSEENRQRWLKERSNG